MAIDVMELKAEMGEKSRFRAAFKGIKKQGGLLIEDGKAKNIVIDIDGETLQMRCCSCIQNRSKLIPIKSPSGRKWHIWKFLPEAKPKKEVHAEAKKLKKNL